MQDFSHRYRDLFCVFFPSLVAKPEVREVAFGEEKLIVFTGPIDVTFERASGRVYRVEVNRAPTDYSQPVHKRELLREERELWVTQMAAILKNKLGVRLERALLDSVVEVRRGGRVLRCSWHMVYFGYDHIRDTFTADFEFEGPILVVKVIVNFGSKTCPARPTVRISPQEAIGFAREALSKYRASFPSGGCPLPPVGQTRNCTLGFIYRNDLYKSPDMVSKACELEGRYITHLCHIVSFDSPSPIEVRVYVDSATGEVVGGEF